jgi:membrane protein YqaA with SNARE-associated domain
MLSGLVATLRAWADQAGGVGLFVLSVVDSAAIPLPNATDALVIYLTLQQPARWWWYAGAAVSGAVVGSLPLYWIGRRGGEALFERRFKGPTGGRALEWYRRSAFGAILVPAFLPPPLPFKIFAVLAGVTALPVWRFVLALTLGRSVRHGVEGVLAARYGDRAGAIFDEWKATIALTLAAAALLAGAVLLWRRRRAGGR